MKVIMLMKNGDEYEFDQVKNTYVQNGKLLVIEHYLMITGNSQISVRKFPLDDIAQLQEFTSGINSAYEEQQAELHGVGTAVEL